MMRVLFLTNLLPYPLDNGGKIKTFTTLKALKKAGHDIDLLCFKEYHGEHPLDNEIQSVCSSVKEVYQLLTTADNKKYMMVK